MMAKRTQFSLVLLANLLSLHGVHSAAAQRWGSPAVISNTVPGGVLVDYSAPSVAADGAGHLVSLWQGYRSPSTDTDIFIARSSDHGTTWTAPVLLHANGASDTGDDGGPRVTTDGLGTWVAVWHSNEDLDGVNGTDGDILVARSTDNGATWTAPMALNTNAPSDGGVDFGPTISTDDAGNWIAAWQSTDTLGGTIGTDVDILTARSTDGGQTWTSPQPLNGNAAVDSGNDYGPRLATDGAGHWVVVWYSFDTLGGTKGNDGDIVTARSIDAGATWTAPTPLNSNATTDSGGDWHAEIATDGDGHWIAVWDSFDSLGGTKGTDADILVARSTDNGLTWSSVATLNSDAAIDRAFDAGPVVTTDGDGNWVVAWESEDSLGGILGRDADIVAARSTDDGATWTPVSSLNANAASDEEGDHSVQMVVEPGGNWLAVWTSYDHLDGAVGGYSNILRAGSTNAGASWTAPMALNMDAASDSSDDSSPQVTNDGDGTWVAVWSAADPLVVPSGNDSDILISRSTDNGATWSAPAALNTNANSDAASDDKPRVVTDGTGKWIAVWTALDFNAPVVHDTLYFAASSDAGATWSAPAPLEAEISMLERRDWALQLAADGFGHWVVAWASSHSLGGTIGSDVDLLFVRSDDGGDTWTEPAPLNTNAATDSGDDEAVSLATDGAGHWTAIWSSNDPLGGMVGTDGDILISRSTDSGTTWSAPVPLNADATIDVSGDGDPRISTDRAGNWLAVWTTQDSLGGTIGNDGDIVAARSTDNGASWTAPSPVNSNATSDVAPDAGATLTTDGHTWLAVWLSFAAMTFEPDIMTARSTDYGATWTAATPLTSNAAPGLSEDTGPQVSTDGAGHWVAVWQSIDGFDGLSTPGRSNVFVALGGACGETPRGGCRAATKSLLHLRNDVNDEKDKLAWKWSGESTTMPELADPTVGADYAFCVYDQNGAIAEVTVPAAGTCGDKPCWTAKRTGFAFKDRAGANHGIQAMSVKASDVGKSAAAVKGKGLNLPDATLGSFALPVTAQLVNLDTDLCLHAGFDSATVTKNNALEFKAKAR